MYTGVARPSCKRNLIVMKLLGFILKLRHSTHLAKSSEAVQNPRQFTVRRNATLAVKMNGRIVQRQSSGGVNSRVVQDAAIQLAVVNWRRKTVKVWDE